MVAINYVNRNRRGISPSWLTKLAENKRNAVHTTHHSVRRNRGSSRQFGAAIGGDVC
jgi:hypothetical protein